jgi:SAM-dependent methyltransferase
MIRSLFRSGISLGGLVAILVVAGIVGCSAHTAPRPEGLPDGINDNFLSEDLDVDQYVERFEGESRAVYAERVAIVQALALSPGDSVADIGAGTGFFSFLFSEAVEDSGRVYAVEISPGFLEHLRGRARAEAPETMQVVEGTERSVELPDASIDLAFICDVYHHFEYPEDSLASLHAAIRPGGSLVLIDFNRIPGESPEWLLEHVRAGREVFQAEVEMAGFVLDEEIRLEGLEDNYILRFDRVD